MKTRTHFTFRIDMWTNDVAAAPLLCAGPTRGGKAGSSVGVRASD